MGGLAFAVQKIDELVTLSRALTEGRDALAEALAASETAVAARRTSTRIHDPAVTARLAAITPEMTRRRAFEARRQVQRAHLALPPDLRMRLWAPASRS